MSSHSSDLKLDWIPQGVMCLCLKSQGQSPPWYPGGVWAPSRSLLWDVRWGQGASPSPACWGCGKHRFPGLAAQLLFIAP